MNKLKVMTVFGTRPEAIKMAPLVKELEKHPHDIQSIVTVTAQHREMLDQVLSIFNIQPNYDLNIMKNRQTLTDITTRALEGLQAVIEQEQPDLVLVHGDTTTTFVASLAAFYQKVKIGHVEAGLRTYDKYSPYPEEMNRQLTGALADLHFAPTIKAYNHLVAENKKSDAIFVTGNTAIDALKTTVFSGYQHQVLQHIQQDRLLLVTAHRRENLGKPMEQIFRAIRRIVNDHPDVQVVFPVHLNPSIQNLSKDILGGEKRIHLIPPLHVLDFHNFAAKAHLILTDSGGVQEEAPSLGVPVLVLRETTERPEGIDAGTLKLVGTSEDVIYEETSKLLVDDKLHQSMAKAKNPYGDGKASERIVKAILYYFQKENTRPDPYMVNV